MPAKYNNDVRAFVFGLIKGVGGESFDIHRIARMVKDRFGHEISSNTVANWQTNMADMMAKYEISDWDIKEAIARGLLGDQRPSEEIQEGEEEEAQGKLPLPGKVPSFKNTAEVIAYCENEGFIVGKNINDIKDILAAKGMSVIDNEGSYMGVQDIFIDTIELDIETVGRNIIANPIIGFYYAYERRRNPKLEIAAWITNCMLEFYNNLDKIYDDRRPVILAVLHG